MRMADDQGQLLASSCQAHKGSAPGLPYADPLAQPVH